MHGREPLVIHERTREHAGVVGEIAITRGPEVLLGERDPRRLVTRRREARLGKDVREDVEDSLGPDGRAGDGDRSARVGARDGT